MFQKPMAKSDDKPKVDTKAEDITPPWLCACEERKFSSLYDILTNNLPSSF